MTIDRRLRIDKRYVEGQKVLEAFEIGTMKTKLQAAIARMDSADVRIFYKGLIQNELAPTAEELVAEVKLK